MLTTVMIPTLYMLRANWAIFTRIRVRRVRRITSNVSRSKEELQVREFL
jgi:hypothetical protein